MNKYRLVVRHEPQTHRECDEGWWYEHCIFEAEDNDSALKKAKTLCDKINDECSRAQ